MAVSFLPFDLRVRAVRELVGTGDSGSLSSGTSVSVTRRPGGRAGDDAGAGERGEEGKMIAGNDEDDIFAVSDNGGPSEMGLSLSLVNIEGG